ncbi:MAG TPA: hypothetical protein PK971_17480, partial [Saprospiraceae bacterium]|nr:hypothetical protein [Saprospiraceae bacterium]HND90130.1 hypothetical protein [Saprospiraceae bacterium]
GPNPPAFLTRNRWAKFLRVENYSPEARQAGSRCVSTFVGAKVHRFIHHPFHPKCSIFLPPV